jgi:hypothetical protein
MRLYLGININPIKPSAGLPNLVRLFIEIIFHYIFKLYTHEVYAFTILIHKQRF